MIDELRNYYSEFIVNTLSSLTDEEINLNSQKSGNIFKDIALGIRLKERFPHNSKGYVFLYNDFYALDEDYLSFKQILDYVSNNGTLDYDTFKLLSSRLIKYKAFDELLLLLQKYKNFTEKLKNDNLTKFLSIDAVKIIFTIIDNDFRENLLVSDDDVILVTSFDVNTATDIEIMDFYRKLDSNRKLSMFTLRVLLLRNSCSKELFDVLKVKLKGEKDFSDRISFVYYALHKSSPLEIEPLLYTMRTFVYYGEYFRAYLLLSEYLCQGGFFSFDLFSLFQVIKFRMGGLNIDNLLSISDNVNPQVKSLLKNESYNLMNHRFNALNFYKSTFLSQSYSIVKPPRVAVCISGQVRSSLKPVYQMFNNIHNADFFISTWDKGNFCEENTMFHLVKLIGKELLLKLPDSYQIIENFVKVFPSTYKKLTQKYAFEITKDYLQKDLDADNVEVDVESEDEFNNYLKQYFFKTLIKQTDSVNGQRRKVSQCKQFYKINKAFMMANKSYDVIVRGRTDFVFELPNINEYISLVNNDKSLLITYYYNTCDIGDQFCIGSYEAMSSYCNAWNFISDSKMLRYSDNLSRASEFGAEPLLASHLSFSNLHIKAVKVKNLHRTTLPCINYFDVSKEIENDLKSFPNSSIFTNFVNAYIEGCRNHKKWNF